ncbi:MAG: hypothetical protein NZ534_05430, partial [Bacteroidia bacterium]|nr:hypothetical protein [Bacteroidia bacterium]
CTEDMALWFGGTQRRFAATRPLNASAGCVVQFWLKTGTAALPPCERPDLTCANASCGEDVFLQYQPPASTTWTTIAHLPAAQYSQWTKVCVPIPPGAQVSGVRFRWFQPEHSLVSGQASDNWALDAVAIDAAPLNADSPYETLLNDAVWHAPDGTVVFAGDTLFLADDSTPYFTLSSALCPQANAWASIQYSRLDIQGLAWLFGTDNACPGDIPPPLGLDAASSVPPGTVFEWSRDGQILPEPPNASIVQLPPLERSARIRLVAAHPTCGLDTAQILVRRPATARTLTLDNDPRPYLERCLSSQQAFVLHSVVGHADTLCPLVGWQVQVGPDGPWQNYAPPSPQLLVQSFEAMALELCGSTTFEQKLALRLRSVHACDCAAEQDYVYFSEPFVLLLFYEPIADSVVFSIEEDTLCQDSDFPNYELSYRPEAPVGDDFDAGVVVKRWRIVRPDGQVHQADTLPSGTWFHPTGWYRITATISGPGECVVFEKQDSFYVKTCAGCSGYCGLPGEYRIFAPSWACQNDCNPAYRIVLNAYPRARIVRVETYRDGWHQYDRYPFLELQDLVVTDGMGNVVEMPEPETDYYMDLPLEVKFTLDHCFDDATDFGLRPVMRMLYSPGVYFYLALPPAWTDVVPRAKKVED